MGCQSDPDHGLLISAIVHMLRLIKADAEEAEDEGSLVGENKMWKIDAYICILTARSLRGHVGFFVELAGRCKHMAKGRSGEVPPGLNKSMLLSEETCKKLPHVTVCLLGKFKGHQGV
jgi:hypothetical protein